MPVTRIAASGNRSWRVATTGIEPPIPTSAGAVPSQAAVRAARAASYAGPAVGRTHGALPLSQATSTDAPHGTCFSRWARRAAYAEMGLSPGASRTLILALALATRALGASRV